MKVLLAASFVIFLPLIQSVILNCTFSLGSWIIIGQNAYDCQSIAENPKNLSIIEEVRGTHMAGKSNADVVVYRQLGNNAPFYQTIPSNLGSIFPNLKGVFFYVPLLRVVSSDLKPLTNLIFFYSWNGAYTNVDGDLFHQNKKLQFMEFNHGKLQNVGENFLSGLDDLKHARFHQTPCIDFKAENSLQIQELKTELLMKCPPLPSKCSMRCSLEGEVDELKLKVGKQDEKITRQDEINSRQDETIARQEKVIAGLIESNESLTERVVELEKIVREIVTRP